MEAILYGMNAGLGLSPHTLGMVLTATADGRKSGFAFMLGALAFDFFLIISALLIQGQLEMGEESKLILRLISGPLIIRMGWKALSSNTRKPEESAFNGPSFKNGIILQIFNPNPYVFWFMIGIPHIIALPKNFQAIEFILIFILVTYGLKTLIMEISVRFSNKDFFKAKMFRMFGQSVALITILNGLYIIIQTGHQLFQV